MTKETDRKMSSPEFEALVAILNQAPTLFGPQQMMQALQAMGPYAAPVAALAPYGAPVAASLAGGQLLAEGNPTVMGGVFGGFAPWVRAAQVVAPFVPNIMEARRAGTSPRRTATPAASRATPMPPPVTPTPPSGPNLRQQAAAAGSAIGTAATRYRQGMEAVRSVPMGLWQNVLQPTIKTLGIPAGVIYGPKYALDPAFRADINEKVGSGIVQPLANWYTGRDPTATPMMASGGPTPTTTPAPTMGPTPINTPTSAPTGGALTYQEDVAAMPDGAVFELAGVGMVQRRGDSLYPMTAPPRR